MDRSRSQRLSRDATAVSRPAGDAAAQSRICYWISTPPPSRRELYRRISMGGVTIEGSIPVAPALYIGFCSAFSSTAGMKASARRQHAAAVSAKRPSTVLIALRARAPLASENPACPVTMSPTSELRLGSRRIDGIGKISRRPTSTCLQEHYEEHQRAAGR